MICLSNVVQSKIVVEQLGEIMKVVNWVIEHIYWILSMVFLVLWVVSAFVTGDVVDCILTYIGFFGCLNLHEISEVEMKFDELMTFDVSDDDIK